MKNNNNDIDLRYKGFYEVYRKIFDDNFLMTTSSDILVKLNSTQISDDEMLIEEATLNDVGEIISNHTVLSSESLNEIFDTMFTRMLGLSFNSECNMIIQTIILGKYYVDNFYLQDNTLAVSILSIDSSVHTATVNGEQIRYDTLDAGDATIINWKKNIYYRLRGDTENTTAMIRIKLEEKK